ncbi:MAG: 3-oxoacyl-[acyl-carrier-protein] synthase III C-terminal domain-containing protein [Pseudomonadota bacterium]
MNFTGSKTVDYRDCRRGQGYGNISSASCAIALDEAIRDGSIKINDLVCWRIHYPATAR